MLSKPDTSGLTWSITHLQPEAGYVQPSLNCCYHHHNAPKPITDPKNTKDQELSLDQLKDAAGGSTAMGYGTLTAMVVPGPIVSNLSPEDSDVRKGNLIGSDNPCCDDVCSPAADNSQPRQQWRGFRLTRFRRSASLSTPRRCPELASLLEVVALHQPALPEVQTLGQM